MVLEDALKVGFTRKRRLIEQVLAELRRRLVALPYGHWHPVCEGLQVRLQPAGHILGSAYVECAVDAAAEDRLAPSTAGGVLRPHQTAQRVVFSGDLGAPTPRCCQRRSHRNALMCWCWRLPMATRCHEDRRTRSARLGR